MTIPPGKPPCLGVVSNEFRPALVKAEGGSRRGPWLRFERALSGCPEYASGRRPWPRAEPARMVGGFRRLARVLGVSMGFCGAAVAMVALRALVSGLRWVRARLVLRSRGRARTSPRAQRRLSGLWAAF